MGTINTTGYFELLKNKMDEYVHFVYKLTKDFPRDELYGCTSQLRRATLSIILNFVEGFARKKIAVKRNFWEISYGSLQESKYLVGFGYSEKYIKEEDYKKSNPNGRGNRCNALEGIGAPVRMIK